MAWTIKGVSGAALSGASRTLAQLAITKCDLIYRSAAPDTLSWTTALDNPTGAGAIIPDFKQQVELYYGTERRFIGYVSGVRTGLRSIQVQVSNVLWLMEQEDLTSAITDDNGNSSERQKYVAAKGDLNVQIGNLIYRINQIGLPVLVGGVAAMYPNTRMTLARMSCAAGLAKLLQRCPDAVTRCDYSGATGTSPWLQVWRRRGTDAMPDTTYTIGTSPIVRGESDLQSRLDLKVARVELNYLDRHPTTGRIRFQIQANGTGAIGETQKITIAGDELVPYMPRNEYETYTIQTVASGSDFVNTMESSLVALRQKYGTTVSVTVSTGETASYWNSWSTNATGVAKPDTSYGTTPVYLPGAYFISRNGKPVALTGKYFLISENLPDWVNRLPGVVVREGTYSGTFYSWRLVDNPQTPATEYPTTPEWLQALGMTKIISRKWIVNTNYLYDLWSKSFSIPCTLVSVNAPADTTLYKPFDYDFEQSIPDSGMAVGLRLAQDWIPWQGQIVLAPGDEVDGMNYMNFAVNLAGSLPGCTAMRALAKSLSYDLIRKRMVWSLGAPARMDVGSSSGRVPGSSQDLVEFT